VFELTLRIVFSLLVVLGLMWGLARLARRPLGTRHGGLIDVLGRQQLSRGASVAVVRVVDKVLVLGVTDNQITLLGDADPDVVDDYHPATPPVHREALSLDALSGTPVAGSHGNLTAPVVSPNGPLAGSILSTRTWSQAWVALRERRTRKP
jgi:flagellar protein FliO/FliZ